MRQHHLLLLLICSLLLPSWGCRKTQSVETTELASQVLEVDIVRVSKNQIDESIELTGTLYPWKFATIASEVTGVIESIEESGKTLDYEIAGQSYSHDLPLDIGHHVKKDDVLVKIGSSEQQHELQLAEARKGLAEKELANLFAWKRSEEIEQLKAQCEECDAVLLDARADLKRSETLVARNAASRKEVDDAQRSVATAQAGKKRAEAALKLAEAGPTLEQIEVAKAQRQLAEAEVASKQDMLRKCTVKCPLEEGWVVERYVGVGDHVTANPSTPLLRVVDSRILMAQVHVPERYQGLIQIGDRAVLTAQGGRAAEEDQGDIAALVVLVNAQIDPDTRTFRVRIGMDNRQNLFKAGTFVKVSIPLHAALDAVVVPTSAITFAKGEPAAFVVRDGIVSRVPVKLGISSRTHYQVVSGLTEDDQVVKGRLSLLAPGLRVKPRTVLTEAARSEDETSPATPSQG